MCLCQKQYNRCQYNGSWKIRLRCDTKGVLQSVDLSAVTCNLEHVRWWYKMDCLYLHSIQIASSSCIMWSKLSINKIWVDIVESFMHNCHALGLGYFSHGVSCMAWQVFLWSTPNESSLWTPGVRKSIHVERGMQHLCNARVSSDFWANLRPTALAPLTHENRKKVTLHWNFPRITRTMEPKKNHMNGVNAWNKFDYLSDGKYICIEYINNTQRRHKE